VTYFLRNETTLIYETTCMHDNWFVSYQTATWYLEFEMFENQVMNWISVSHLKKMLTVVLVFMDSFNVSNKKTSLLLLLQPSSSSCACIHRGFIPLGFLSMDLCFKQTLSIYIVHPLIYLLGSVMSVGQSTHIML
jgi:hypothetical protein